MRVKIQVNESDIRNSEKGSFSRNPIAKAFRRATGLRRVELSADSIIVWDNKDNLIVDKPLPKKAIQFNDTFNRKGCVAVDPIEFVVQLPKDLVKNKE